MRGSPHLRRERRNVGFAYAPVARSEYWPSQLANRSSQVTSQPLKCPTTLGRHHPRRDIIRQMPIAHIRVGAVLGTIALVAVGGLLFAPGTSFGQRVLEITGGILGGAVLHTTGWVGAFRRWDRRRRHEPGPVLLISAVAPWLVIFGSFFVRAYPPALFLSACGGVLVSVFWWHPGWTPT